MEHIILGINIINSWIIELIASQRQEVILENYNSHYGKMQLISCTEPGIIDWSDYQSESNLAGKHRGVWKFTHSRSDSYFFVALLNINQLKRELQIPHKLTANYKIWRKMFTLVARTQLHVQSNIRGTHLVIFAWMSKANTETQIINGAAKKVPKIECQEAIVCDLQGNTIYWTGANESAKKLIRGINKTLFYKVWKPSLNISWENLIRQINFTHWLKIYCKKYFGAEFILQPKKGQKLKKYKNIENQNSVHSKEL